MKLILASGSPRRKELLARLTDNFEIIVSDVDEVAVDDPWRTAEGLAREKARAVFVSYTDCAIIGGDTVVALPEGGKYRQFAKPEDAEDAVRMLSELSGKTHLVITGVAFITPLREDVWSETTKVTFRKLGEAEIRDYVATGEPMDKAGAYGIQGMGGSIIERFDGPLENVIGLPLEKLTVALGQVGLLKKA